MWLIGASVCLLAAPWVQVSVSVGNGWPHNALRHHWLMPISCHFRDCKALLVTSLTHVSGAVTSVQTFTFIYSWCNRLLCHFLAFCWKDIVVNFLWEQARYGQKLGHIQKRLHFDAWGVWLVIYSLSPMLQSQLAGFHVLIECGHERELW